MAAGTSTSKVGCVLVAPLFVLAGILALWENEGRFDYHAAAREARVIDSAPEGTAAATVAMSADLDGGIFIAGEYLQEFPGYLVVERSAEIYSWHERREDNRTTWRQGWYASVQDNSRNHGLRQTLRSATLYPPRYRLGDLEIDPARIHFADAYVAIPIDDLTLGPAGVRHALEKLDSVLYRVNNGAEPPFGNERVSYEGIPTASRASYFGRVVGGRALGKQFVFGQSIISDFIRNDGILHHLVMGEREEALGKLEAHHQHLTWLVRAGGTLVIVLGINAFLRGFVYFLSRVPFIGDLVNAGALLVSLAVGLPIALFVILAALFVHNPLSIALPAILVVAGVLVFARHAKTVGANVQRVLAGELEAGRTPADAAAPAAHTVEDTFVNLAKLALAEGGLDKREQRYLIRWGAKNGFGKEQMQALFARAKREGGAPAASSRDDLTVLVCLALADGMLSVKEFRHLVAVGEKLGMTRDDVRAIIAEVESGAPIPA